MKQLYAIGEKNRIQPHTLLLILYATYSVWQMGVVYYSGTTLSLYGRVPVQLNNTVCLGLMIAGYISAIILNVAFIKKTILFGKISLIIAFIVNVLTFIPAGEKFLLSMQYISVFWCVFLIGVCYNIETFLFDNKSEQKLAFICPAVIGVFIGIMQGDFFSIPFIAFEIISLLILALLLFIFFKLPKSIDTPVMTVREARMDNSMPKHMKLGLYGAIFISTITLAFGLIVAETVKYGIGIFFFSGIISVVYFAFLVYKVKVSPFKIFTFMFGIAAIGFVFSALSSIYPKLIYVAIVLCGVAAITSSMVGFLSNTIATFKPTRTVGQSVVVIGLIIVLLQGLTLNAFRNSIAILFTVLSVVSITAMVIYLSFESNLSYLWHLLINNATLSKADDADSDLLPLSERDDSTADIAAATGFTATEVPATDTESTVTVTAFSALSPREKQIVDYILSGYGNAEIAKLMFLAENTVKSYRKELYFKLQIHSRRELFAIAEENKIS